MKTLYALVVIALLGGVATADEDSGWHRPAGTRFGHGFRVGWMYLDNVDKPTRESGKSLMQELGLKSPHMMLLGYEAFYRIVGHSWIDVLFVGNVTVAGLEQSKFIPAGSALIGFEFARKLQLGVGELRLHAVAVALPERRLHRPALAVVEIRDLVFCHGTHHAVSRR